MRIVKKELIALYSAEFAHYAYLDYSYTVPDISPRQPVSRWGRGPKKISHLIKQAGVYNADVPQTPHTPRLMRIYPCQAV